MLVLHLSSSRLWAPLTCLVMWGAAVSAGLADDKAAGDPSSATAENLQEELTPEAAQVVAALRESLPEDAEARLMLEDIVSGRQLGPGDGYGATSTGGDTGKKDGVPGIGTPPVINAGFSLPVAPLGASSPIDSTGAVRRMGDLGALGRGGAQTFDRSRYNDLISPNPGAPFTGSGATGATPGLQAHPSSLTS